MDQQSDIRKFRELTGVALIKSPLDTYPDQEYQNGSITIYFLHELSFGLVGESRLTEYTQLP